MHPATFKLCLTALSLFVSSCYAQGAYGSGDKSLPTQVKLDSGIVVGTTTTLPSATASVHKFLGIPFAKSPPARFEPPKPPEAWRKPLGVREFKPSCLQAFSNSNNAIVEFFNKPAPPESEDCLYLNVFAPSTPPPQEGRAVLFWIHGGGFVWGTAGLPMYDGSAFAAYEDVIVVSANYRTNVFGFPGAPELPPEQRNLGFLDQRAALDWVQRNICAFGGDPRKVTIFGESAGAASADILLTSFKTAPPFRAAILQSGQYSHRPLPIPAVSPSWAILAAALKCETIGKPDNLTCIRDAPAETIKRLIVEQRIAFSPVIDNVTLIEGRVAARAAGNFARVPILGGTTADEGKLFTLEMTNLTEFMNTFFGPSPELQQAVTKAYPLGKDGLESVSDVIGKISTDLLFQCPFALLSTATAAIGVPAWRYLLKASFHNITPRGLDVGAFHGSDIPLVFSTYPRENATNQQIELSNYMRGVWARFAKDPQQGPGWNPVGSGQDLGVLGQGESSGVTVIPDEEVDKNCYIFRPIYDRFA